MCPTYLSVHNESEKSVMIVNRPTVYSQEVGADTSLSGEKHDSFNYRNSDRTKLIQ